MHYIHIALSFFFFLNKNLDYPVFCQKKAVISFLSFFLLFDIRVGFENIYWERREEWHTNSTSHMLCPWPFTYLDTPGNDFLFSNMRVK